MLSPTPRLFGRRLIFRELPYVAVLALSIFGAAYTSFSGTPMREYWIALGPIIGLVCILRNGGRRETGRAGCG